MKKFNILVSILIIILFSVTCSKTNSEKNSEKNHEITSEEPSDEFFSTPDNSVKLYVNYKALGVSKLLPKVSRDVVAALGSKNSFTIQESQIDEIKAFTDELVKDDKTELDITRSILKWVKNNIDYDNANNNPYDVFKNRVAICQGYANLTEVMLHTQGIASLVANGFLGTMGGHAWNYVYADGNWYIIDPTNDGSAVYNMLNVESYQNWLIPHSLDLLNIFEDDNFGYNYTEGHLNIAKIKSRESNLTIPYSTNGFVISSLNPSEDIPESVSQIFIGSNIQTLGENIVGLQYADKSLKCAYVHKNNRDLQSISHCIYKKNESIPIFIPSKLEKIVLKSMINVSKNTVYNHNYVKEIVFAAGTKVIENYAIENCPNLTTAYIPATTAVDKDAFYKVNKDFKIVRLD